MTVVVGLDHGNGWVKVKTEGKEITLPSYFANKADLGDDFIKSKYKLNEYTSNDDKGNTYLWGEDISKLNSKYLIPTYGMQDRYKQDRYNLLTQFALASVLEGSEEDVLVVTGVPSSEKGTIKEEDLIDVIKGTHVVSINGEEKIIKVKQVTVLAQPIGSVLSLYLDEEGSVEDDSYEDSLIGVIDIGSGTTDIDQVEDLRREGATPSLPEGISDVYTDIVEYVRKENPNLTVSIQDIEFNFETGIYRESKRTASIDFTKEKEKAVKKLADKIIQHLAQTWKTWDKFDEIIITGGGAAPLKKALSDLLSDVNVIENSQTANAEGFFRYGQYQKGE